MKFVLHIGPHKTGSSYIQLECATCRDQLRQYGILYPRTWNKEEFAHDAIYHQLRQKHDDFFFSNFGTAVAEAGPGIELMLISAENIEYLEPEAIEVIAKKFVPSCTKIVYYVRSWPALLSSTWQERVKHGATVTFAEHAAQHLDNPLLSAVLNYNIVLSRYAEVFGADHIELRIYDNLLDTGQDLFEDVIGLCLGTQSPLRGRGIKENASLTALDIEIVRLLNGVILGPSGALTTGVLNGYLALRRSSDEVERLSAELEIVAAPYRRNLRLSSSSASMRVIEDAMIATYPHIGPRRVPDRLFDSERDAQTVFYSSDLLIDDTAKELITQLASEVRRELGQHVPARVPLGLLSAGCVANGPERGSGVPPTSGTGSADMPVVLPAGGSPFELGEMAIFVVEPVGFYADRWVRARAVLRCRALQGITRVVLRLWVPPGDEPLALTLRIAGELDLTLPAPANLVSVLQYPVRIASASDFTIELVADRERQLSDTDRRRASYVVEAISFA